MNDDKKIELCKTYAATIVALGQAISTAETLEECKSFLEPMNVTHSMLFQMFPATKTCQWEACSTNVDERSRGKKYCSKHAKKFFGTKKRQRIDDEDE